MFGLERHYKFWRNFLIKVLHLQILEEFARNDASASTYNFQLWWETNMLSSLQIPMTSVETERKRKKRKASTSTLVLSSSKEMKFIDYIDFFRLDDIICVSCRLGVISGNSLIIPSL